MSEWRKEGPCSQGTDSEQFSMKHWPNRAEIQWSRAERKYTHSHWLCAISNSWIMTANSWLCSNIFLGTVGGSCHSLKQWWFGLRGNYTVASGFESSLGDWRAMEQLLHLEGILHCCFPLPPPSASLNLLTYRLWLYLSSQLRLGTESTPLHLATKFWAQIMGLRRAQDGAEFWYLF